MRRACEPRLQGLKGLKGPRAALAAAGALAVVAATAAAASPQPPCASPVYLTFDTGHMGVAPLVAEVLNRQQVKVSFFLAQERTLNGGHSLDEEWAPWWRQRAAEGHAVGSHTWDHWVWQADTAGGWRFKATQGPRAGQVFTATEADYCEQLRRPQARWAAMTGQAMGPWFRAPAGRTSPSLEAAAQRCGFTHVGWSPAGFLGDELPSPPHTNAKLLAQALRQVRAGDVLVAHLGIWSRQEVWAPAVLEPLIEGLKAKGLCFATLHQHPVWGRVVPKEQT